MDVGVRCSYRSRVPRPPTAPGRVLTSHLIKDQTSIQPCHIMSCVFRAYLGAVTGPGRVAAVRAGGM